MTDTTFVDASATVNGTVIVAQWLNDVNTNTYTQLAAVAGTNTITANGASTVTVGYPRGVAFRFLPINTNTGPATINISGLGVKNITKFGTAPLAAGDLIAGSWAYLTYDGTQFQLINAGGPLTGVDTYVTTAGSTSAYTLTFQGSFAFISGYAVKLIFNATNTTTTPTLNVNGSGVVAMKVMDTNGNKIDPIVGAFAINTPATAIYDGVNWIIVPEYTPGRLLNIQTFGVAGSSVYTPTPGTASVVVEMCGGGGAGGGVAATAAGQFASGGGGASGAYTKSRFTTAFSGVTVTVGAGGTGISAATGNTGGTSSFGALVTAPGGIGGSVGNAVASGPTQATGAGGAGQDPTGSFFVGNRGIIGGLGSLFSTSPVTGQGAPSPFGGGGTAVGFGSATGLVGLGYGGGGGGAGNGASSAAQVGGAGVAGRVVVYEYS